MKRILSLLVLLAAILLWTGFHFDRKPRQITLLEQRSARVHVYYVANLSQRIPEITKQLESNLEDSERATGKRLERPLKAFLFTNWEEKGNHSKDVRVTHVDHSEQAVYCIVNQEWNGIRERPEFQLLFRKAHGKAYQPEFEEYAAAAWSGIWFQKPLHEWASFLKSRKLMPHFPSLFQDEQSSRFIRYPWSSLLFKFIQEQYGSTAVVNLYKKGELPSDLSERWKTYLANIPLRKKAEYTFRPAFQKGMSYAYWNSYDGGYATSKSRESLDELKNTGIDSIASIPYGYMRSNHSPTIGFPGHHIAGENDESLWALAADARARKIKVMLKPQIWINHNSWPGKVDFQSQQEWNTWLSNYEKWIVHYAIIAELTNADLFCIGTEFVQASLKNPSGWRKIIATVRNIYHGPLTYAANWGREFEEIQFWDALDYMGLDNYYPVRASEKEGYEAAKAGFQKQKEKLRELAVRHKKPLLFTEIGYMANTKAGMGSQEFEATSADYSEPHQEACYRLALETYWNEPWFAGMYWWKWFSEPKDRGKSADSHSPHGRLAQKVLAEWYRKSRNQK